ncbi:MAG: NADH-quinone oxidoreductase subunit L [Acidobacteria bacterium]|nr:MAG: NADH-quinone oxidoreductase subunit L [Acidobacteriota bacterium]PYT86721.1 MAG: NADH-quinone oxidoreductase subunit L [Acidobacteriota bacterium]
MTPTGYFLEHLWLIPLFPLATASLMLLVGRRLRKSAVSLFCVGSVGVSFAYALGAVTQLLSAPPENRVVQHILFEWLAPGQMLLSSGQVVPFTADWGYLLDPLSSVMVLVVTGVGFLIHVYSIGYMGHEGGYYRFFGYMNLFMFSMLTLVLANNMLLMFVGWEGVGLCSYLLIGFYFLKKSASDAGKKAFIVNRIGDAGFILGILLTAVTFATIRFTSAGLTDTAANSGILQALDGALSAHALAAGAPVLTTIALLLFVGATGKSAQIPLYVWLPDAMEGPTPVSALIHAATMVTAGVYMVVRMNAIYRLAPLAMDVVAVIGVVTAIFAASMALVQNDIKKVLAYSTISQLGYMFLALGVGAFAAGIFHLMTHAFFKALLFLGAGSVIHAMSGEQDIQKMGGLWGEIPVTARTFFVATLAIAGIPPLAGFFSKDEILGRAFERHPALWIVGFITAGMTAFYMFRLVFLTFFGYSRADNHAQKHIHESPRTMTIPLMILAVLSVVGGWIGWPASLFGSNQFEKFLEPVMSSAGATESAKAVQESSTTEYFLMLASIAIAVAGIWVAYEFYRTKRFAPELVAGKMKGFYRVLFHKYYVDEIYDALFVNRTKDLGTLLGQIDAKVIDGVGVDGTGWLARFGSTLSMWWDKWIIDGLLNFGAKFTQLLSFPIRFLQTGTFSTYALLILVGLAILLAYYQQHLHVVLRGAR